MRLNHKTLESTTNQYIYKDMKGLFIIHEPENGDWVLVSKDASGKTGVFKVELKDLERYKVEY